MNAVSLFSKEKVTEFDRFWREMAPVPGRTAGSLRFALATALSALALLVLQAPVGFIPPALFMLFLVSHETPDQCFRDLLTCLIAGTVGTTVTLLLVGATGNHPVARVIGLAVLTFLASFFCRTSKLPAAAMSFGCLAYLVISLWELHLRDEKILHLSLWSMGAVSAVAIVSSSVEYLLNRVDPVTSLRRELQVRCSALEHLFRLCADRADAGLIEKQQAVVRRYAVTGEGRLHVLLERASQSGSSSDEQLSRLRASTLTVDRLLLLSAAFAAHGDIEATDPARLAAIAGRIAAAGEGRPEEINSGGGNSAVSGDDELDRIEQTLLHFGSLRDPGPAVPRRASAPGGSWLASLKRLLIPDAFTNPDHLVYAAKLSLCATICYVIYNGLKWPGISTAYFTVYFTGLSTTGTTNRKLFFRVIGSTFGGLVLGIGSLVFVFPNIEGVTGFLLVIAAIAFLGAWAAGSPYFGYIGLQIAFSYYLLAFERLRAPDQMTPARDRLLGIALGFLVMFLVFHQVRPERTVDTMRRLLARLLRAEAEMLRLLGAEPGGTSTEQVAAIRRQIAPLLANLQNFAHAVAFELPPDRAADLRLSDEILNATARTEELLILVSAWPDDDRASKTRIALENSLCNLASVLEHAPDVSPVPTPEPLLRVSTASPSWANKAVDLYLELRMICDGIAQTRA